MKSLTPDDEDSVWAAAYAVGLLVVSVNLQGIIQFGSVPEVLDEKASKLADLAVERFRKRSTDKAPSVRGTPRSRRPYPGEY